MNEYLVFYNGVSWTCEIENDNEEIVDYATGDDPIMALQKALDIEKLIK